MDDEIGGNEGSGERLRLRMLDVTEASFKTFFDPLPKPSLPERLANQATWLWAECFLLPNPGQTDAPSPPCYLNRVRPPSHQSR